jgi:hypothetical protein
MIWTVIVWYRSKADIKHAVQHPKFMMAATAPEVPSPALTAHEQALLVLAPGNKALHQMMPPPVAPVVAKWERIRDFLNPAPAATLVETENVKWFLSFSGSGFSGL